MNCANVDVRLRPVPRLNGAVTAQRAVPTKFGNRIHQDVFFAFDSMALTA
jgi:hypothetical protein